MITKSEIPEGQLPITPQNNVTSDIHRILGMESGDPRSCTSFQTRLGFSSLIGQAQKIENSGSVKKGEETARIARILEDFRASCSNTIKCPLTERCDGCINEDLKKQVD